jgi:hypothetical protein
LPAAGLAVCGDKTLKLDGAGWAPWLGQAVTAALPLDGGAWVVASAQGQLGRVEPGGAPTWAKLKPLSKLDDEERYLYRPLGLEEAPLTQVAGLFRVHDNQILAVTVGAGAWSSADEGKTWKEFGWVPRFAALEGPRPIQVRDLVLGEHGKVAFLWDPEGPEASRVALDKLVAAGAEDTTEGGPRLATGTLFEQKLEIRAIPVGHDPRLIASPKGKSLLWLYLRHPTRHEATRFQSYDWGKTWMDNGYLDQDLAAATGSRRRAALVGLDDAEQPVLRVQRPSGRMAYAKVSLPAGEGPLRIVLDDLEEPRVLALARGPSLVAYDVSEVKEDPRLLWYYVPLVAFALIALPLVLRRVWHEYQDGKAEDAEIEALTQGVSLEDPP